MRISDSSLLRGCRTSAAFCAGGAGVVATLCLRDYVWPDGRFALVRGHVSLLALVGYAVVLLACVVVVGAAVRNLPLRAWAWSSATAGGCIIAVALVFSARLSAGDGGLHADVAPLTNGPALVPPGIVLPNPVADWRGDLKAWTVAVAAFGIVELASVVVAVVGRERRAFGEEV